MALRGKLPVHRTTQGLETLKSAMQTNLLFVTVISLCLQGSCGFMTPQMVNNMLSAGRPPLQPHIDGEVSTQCEADLAEVFATKSAELLQVADAIGKPQAGLLAGNLAWIGHFDECTNITGFKYCLSYLKLKLPSNISSPTGNMQISWGLCVPESCSDSDILSSLDDLLVEVEAPFNITGVTASSVICTKDPPAPYGTGFIVTTLIIGSIAVLMILGAFLDTTLRSINYKPPPSSQQLIANRTARTADVYPYQRVTDPVTDGDGTVRADPGEGEVQEIAEEKPTACARAWQQFLLHFALNRNLAKLFNAKTSQGSIGCLNGIRVISMTWVILGHVSSFMFSGGIVANPVYGYAFVTRFGFQAIANAFFSVDSFFFLSGLLVAYMTLGRMTKTGGKIPWLWFYFHRYWRLTPALGMTTLIWMFLHPHLGTGPVWQSTVIDPYCPSAWWTNLLYINNFVGNGNCIAWVWYLANDMQFFVISPFLLILLYRVPIFGLITMATLCIVSMVTTGIIMVKYNFSAVMMDGGDPHQDPNHSFMTEVYNKPYCRIAPYLVGMAMGYFLHLYKNQTFKLSPPVVAAGWAIATAIGMAVVYGLYGNYHGHPLTVTDSAIYMALCRFAWAVSLSWVVFACRYGYGGWVNDFLSWDLWIPMSRLTYSAYLLHPIIIFTYVCNFANPYFYSLYILSFEVAAIVALAYTAAILMAMFVEFPFANLEKMFMPSGEKTTK